MEENVFYNESHLSANVSDASSYIALHSVVLYKTMYLKIHLVPILYIVPSNINSKQKRVMIFHLLTNHHNE